MNLYSAIAVSPVRHPDVNADTAAKLIDFLTSDDVQDIIAAHGVCDFGAPLLVPARDWRPAGVASGSVDQAEGVLRCPQE